MAAAWKRLVRFVPRSSSSKILIGQPVDESLDVGLAVYNNQDVNVDVFSGSSILDAGKPTGQQETIGKLLSPLARREVGTIRCIGLNYKKHAEEAGMELPSVPTVFLKPDTALSDPYPTQTTTLPRETKNTDTGDFESELTFIISKTAKNVSQESALDYVLGFTAGNDVSSRAAQFATTQWTYSKGFDESAPIGPVVLNAKEVPDIAKLKMRGIRNGEVMQESTMEDLIFSVPKIVEFLSQGTTLQAGTVVMTGTPAGVGAMRKPKVVLRDGDEFRVELLPGVGTLVNKFVWEK